MTISSLSGLPYASLLANQSGSGNGASTTAADSASIGSQLLAAVAQVQGDNSTSSNSALQDMVSLSPAAMGQTDTTPQTYNAKGLLQQVQSNLMLNDPLLQSDTTDTSNTIDNSLLQSLISSHQIPTTTKNTVGTADTTASSQTSANASNSMANSQTQAPAGSAGSTESNANWAQLLKQNPSLASVLVQSQTDQGLIKMVGQ